LPYEIRIAKGKAHFTRARSAKQKGKKRNKETTSLSLFNEMYLTGVPKTLDGTYG
jgi:hypothetical protein